MWLRHLAVNGTGGLDVKHHTPLAGAKGRGQARGQVGQSLWRHALSDLDFLKAPQSRLRAKSGAAVRFAGRTLHVKRDWKLFPKFICGSLVAAVKGQRWFETCLNLRAMLLGFGGL